MPSADAEKGDLEERLRQHEAKIAALEETVARLVEGARVDYRALHYPEPIATPLACEQSAARFNEKFFSVLDAGEACVKYVAATIIAVTFSNQSSGAGVST
jgi:hypothetical protein